METPKDKIDAFDKMQREEFVAAANAGENMDLAQERIKRLTRPMYLRILAESNPDEEPVIIPFPNSRPPAA